MVTFELDQTAALTDKEKRILAEVKKLPAVYDDDSPELTEDLERAFIAARKAKPFRKELITLYVSASTIRKGKSLGADSVAILSKLLDKAVDAYPVSP